jgi:hypothetical protein
MALAAKALRGESVPERTVAPVSSFPKIEKLRGYRTSALAGAR